MLKRTDKLALLCEGALSDNSSKMAHGLLKYSLNKIVCAIDSQCVCDDIAAIMPGGQSCPSVATVDEATALGANVVVLGVATSGGYIPSEWYPVLDRAVENGMSLVNGLHERLNERYAQLRNGQWIWDVRVEPSELQIAEGLAAKLNNKRLLMIGTDMAIGKMTAGLQIHKAARDMGLNAEFVATGQIGIVISGRGVALDAVRIDFAAGAIEREVMACQDAELVIVEGQGSLINPSSSANMPLIRGSMPTHLVMCHQAGKESLRRFPHIRIPPLDQLMTLYQDLAEACCTFCRPVPAGICLNTAHLPEDEALKAIAEYEAKYGWPCTDPVRFGADKIVEVLAI